MRFIVLGLGFCFLTQLQMGRQLGSESARVTIIVSDTLGLALQDASVVLTSVGPRQKFTAVGGEAKFEQIPFGQYDLEVRLPGFPTRETRIRVFQQSLALRIGLDVPMPHASQRMVVSGNVSNAKDLSDMWVRLVTIYSNDFIENAVDRQGKFELVDIPPGPALLIVFQRHQIVATKATNVSERNQQVTIALNSASLR
jgi:hypothetical protein